jgi:Na+/H+ antiporter NhaD/arsenite permease-like protein
MMIASTFVMAGLVPVPVAAQVQVSGVPVAFILLGLTLLGVALFHHQSLPIAVAGMTGILAYTLFVAGFREGPGWTGMVAHFAHEWVTLANLFALLVGFWLLARHFEESQVPAVLPRFLPDDWKGGFVLLIAVFVLSTFLDNIAAALIGGAVANIVFRKKVHIGYLAALVAASNAGGAGSVVGDTTTTMMWLRGVSPLDVTHAFVAGIVALLTFGVPASFQQQKFSPITMDEGSHPPVDWKRVGIVAFVLIAAVATNVFINVRLPEISESFPFIGAAVWVALGIGSFWRQPDWKILPATVKGSVFLLALVLSATLMPVERLPAASWQTAFGLGWLSAVFDNIPLTALALEQGGYDWGVLAFTVGFGGSMVWFGSSAGVALTTLFPDGRSAVAWVRHGWHVILAYVVGFFALLFIVGWQPHPPKKSRAPAAVHSVHQ